MELTKLNESNLKSIFFRYVTNSVIGMAGLSFNVFTDTFFIANGIGSKALAALNIALPMFSLLTAISLMNAIGCASLYTMLKAGKHDDEANEMFTHGFILAIIQSVIFFIVGFFLNEPLAMILGADETMVADVSQYLRPFLSLGFLFLFNQLFICIIRNDQAPGLSMKAMVIGSFVNIILDYIFIYHFHWGLFGASFATCFSPLTSMLVLSIHKLKHHNQFHLVKIKMKWSIVTHIYRIGFPSFVNEISSGIVMLAFNYMLLKYGGNVAIAAYGIIANLALIVLAIYSGVGQGIQPIVSYLCGSHQMGLAFKTARYALLLTSILGIFFTMCGILFPHQLISIFSSDGNVLLETIATQGIFLYFPSFLFAGCSIAITSFLSSIHEVKESSIVSIGRGFVFVLLFLFILPVFLQENGIWLSITIAEFVTFIIAIYYFVRHYRFR